MRDYNLINVFQIFYMSNHKSTVKLIEEFDCYNTDILKIQLDI